MATKTIKAYVFDTEQDVKDKISIIEETRGIPYPGASKYCFYQFNNEKWIVKYSYDIGMSEAFGYDPIDFEYEENYPYYIEFESITSILKIYTYNLYPDPFIVVNIEDLSQQHQDVMNGLKALISVDYFGFTKVEFVRKDSLVKIHTLSDGIVSLPMAGMSEPNVVAYESAGAVCNELVEIL